MLASVLYQVCTLSRQASWFSSKAMISLSAISNSMPVICRPMQALGSAHEGTNFPLHSFIHVIIYVFMHSSCIHSFIHSFIHTFIHSFIHSFMQSFTCLFIHVRIYCFIHSFLHSLTHSLICLFVHSFIHLCGNSFTYSVAHSLSQSFLQPILSPKVRYVQPLVAPHSRSCFGNQHTSNSVC